MSQDPEEQPSTGVLGRIGSWLSPWRGKGPKSPTENASPTSDQALKSEGEEESGDLVRPQAGEQQLGEEKERSCNPNALSLTRDIFHCEKDATESDHKHSFVESRTETGEGGPKEEEFVDFRKGQGKEREESNSSTAVSGNPEKNASHLTHLSSFSKQGVAWDSDQKHTQLQPQRQAQAQTGKKLRVYLEETSVTHSSEDTCVGQEVVRTEVTKSLKALSKTKSSPGFDLSRSSSSTNTENKSASVRPTGGAHSYDSTVVGVSLRSDKDSQLELEPEKEQTETDSMGRKHTARKKSRKNSQGDGGRSPQEKTPPSDQLAPEGNPSSANTVTSPQDKRPKTHKGESSLNSSSNDNPTSRVSPEGGGSRAKCPDTVRQLDDFQDSKSVIADTPACVDTPVDVGADMEDNDSFYKVERKTETSESKRRSIKLSQSEVKLFSKNVPLNPNQSPPVENLDLKSALKTTRDEEKDKPRTETDARIHDLKKNGEPLKPYSWIADKISLFECQQAVGDHKQTFKTSRSADVSPVRKATERVKADFLFSDQRSRSTECYGAARSNSASPVREKLMSIKERAKNFTGATIAESKPALPQKAAMPRMSQKSTLSVDAAFQESTNPDSQGKLDIEEQIQTREKAEITSKLDRQDITAVETLIPKEQPKDTKITDTEASKKPNLSTKSDSVETDISAKEMPDSSEMNNNVSPQSKGPSRTGSRSRKKKSKEPTSPISPNSKNKPRMKLEVTALKTKQVGDTTETVSAPKQLTEKASSPSDKAQRHMSDKQSPLDTKQKTLKDLEVPAEQKKLSDSSFKESIDKPVSREEGLPVNKDEPDSVTRSSGTKKSVDKDPVILQQMEEKESGHSLVFTQEEEKSCKDSKEMPASSPTPPLEQPTEKTNIVKPESPVVHCKLDEELLVQPESKSAGKERQPSEKDSKQTLQPQNKDKEPINQPESKYVEILEKAGNKKTHQTEKSDKEQLLQSDKNSIKDRVSDSGEGTSGVEGSVGTKDERKSAKTEQKTQSAKDVTKPESSQPDPNSQVIEKKRGSSDPPAQTQHVSQTETTQPEKPTVCAVTPVNETMSETESDKGPLKGETVTNVLPKLQMKSTESPGTQTEPVVSAAEPQTNSVSVEKTQNSPDDSLTHGAHDEFSSSKAITKATTAVGEIIVKAANDTPALITAQSDSMSAKESPVKGLTPISVSKSVSSEKPGQDDEDKNSSVKSVPPEVKLSGDIIKLASSRPQCEESKRPESASGTTSSNHAGNVVHNSSDCSAAKSTMNVVEKTAEKTLKLPVNELPPVANGDISLQPQLPAVKRELVNKPSQNPKASTTLEANKMSQNSIQRSAMKKLHLPRGLSKDDSSKQQDAPSSWLDVDFPKRKLKVAEPKLSSSGSESNLLDTSDKVDDDNFIEKIKKLCAPFSLPPRKHNHLRPPQPPFAMPAIKEDRFEKTFDPDEFKFGLRKNQFSFDTASSQLAKLQNIDTKSSLKPARASLADRSMLLNSLDTHSRLREKNPVMDEEDTQIKVKSRLEGSCVLSSLSSIFRGKRNGVQTQAEGTKSGDVSPSEDYQLSPPSLSPLPLQSVSATGPINDILAKQSPAPSVREDAQAVEAVVSDSGPPLPSFNNIKLPDYLEKYLPQVNPLQSTQGQEQVKDEVDGKMTAPVSRGEADMTGKPALLLPNAVPACLPGIPPTTHPTPSEPKVPAAQPQGLLSKNIRTVKGLHKRPGKMVLFENAPFSGQAYEIYRDVADATSLQLSPLISVKVVRGCWVLYEKPDFQGRYIALEEGVIELANVWAESELETEPHNNPPMSIGSIRLAVSDYSIPRIDLFTEPEGHGRVTPYHDDTVEMSSFGIPQSTASIQVHSGVWLVFSDPGFQGMSAVLETGTYPFPETWGFPSPFVGSLRPLKMGGFKVENPSEVKAVVYEKPHFEGSSLEIDSEVFSFCEGDFATDPNKLDSVGSLKIIGGLWVGYSQPGFEGQQHILEEGEYLDCSDWGSSEQILSLRPILNDFMAPHLKMFSNREFDELGVNIDLTGPVINMDDTGYGMKTQSIEVVNGIWVVFEEPGFCGDSYILEKGLYGSPDDWGALQPRVASVMPVQLDNFENSAKFKVQLFSDPGFQGTVLVLEDSVASLQDGFSVASCKVLAGSWLAFEGKDFTSRMYVLEEGNYPDLRAMGRDNPSSSILSLQTVGFEFSLPSITLFERSGLRGKKVVLTDGSVNLQLAGGCSRVQSVLVEGAMWILYERINYRGAQILLKPGEILDWRKFSSWQKIGSLRPLIQKQVHFRLRNRQTGLMMSVTGSLDDFKLLRIQEAEETDGFEQMWCYHNGYLRCKLLEECTLSPSSSVTIAGCRVGLTPEPGIHLWSITPEGFIRYTPTPDLVLEVKGGQHYDKNQVILNSCNPNKLQQRWNVEII